MNERNKPTRSLRVPSIMTLLPSLPLSHLSSGRCESFHRLNKIRPKVPSSPREVNSTTLSGTAAKSANSAREGPYERDAGTASINLGSFEEYVCIRAWGLGKNSRCLV